MKNPTFTTLAQNTHTKRQINHLKNNSMKNITSLRFRFSVLFLLFGLSFVQAQNKYISNQFLTNYYLNATDQKVDSDPIKSNWDEAAWEIVPVNIENENMVFIVNVKSDLALTANEKSVFLSARDNNSSLQKWKLVFDKKTETCTIQNESNSKYLINWSKPDELGLSEFVIFAQCSWFITDVKEQIEIDENTLVLYTLPTCGRCKSTREYLKSNNIKFVEYDIKGDKLNKEKMYEQLYSKTKFKGGSVTMPVIVYKDEISYSIKNLDKFLKELK
jgi:glutaredoxin